MFDTFTKKCTRNYTAAYTNLDDGNSTQNSEYGQLTTDTGSGTE